MTLIANINSVYTNSIAGGLIASEFAGAWSTTENCDGTISGRTSEFLGAWSTTENCDGTVSGRTSEFAGAWSTVENC